MPQPAASVQPPPTNPHVTIPSQTFFHRPQPVSYSPEKNRHNNNRGGNSNSAPRPPNGPQNLNSNSSFKSGNGAFIPLQAVRNATKRQYNNPTQQNLASGSSGSKNDMDKNKNSDKLEKNLNQQKNNDKNVTDVNVTKSNQKSTGPPKPRPSRVAAKFSVNLNC